MQARTALGAAGVGALIVAFVPTDATAGNDHHGHGPPVHISISGPNSGNFQGFVTPTGWALAVRIEAPDSVAIVESPEEPTQPIGRREAIVLTWHRCAANCRRSCTSSLVHTRTYFANRRGERSLLTSIRSPRW